MKNATSKDQIPDIPWFARNLESKIGEAVLNIVPGVLKGSIILMKKDIEEPKEPRRNAEMLKRSLIFCLAIQAQKRDEGEGLASLHQEYLKLQM